MTERERIETQIKEASEQLVCLRGIKAEGPLGKIPIDVVLAVCEEATRKVRAVMDSQMAPRSSALYVEATIDDIVDDLKSRRVAGDEVSLADFGRIASSALGQVGKTSREFRSLMAWSVVVVSTLKLIWQ